MSPQSLLNRKLLHAASNKGDHRRLAVCAHEIGHALTWMATGIEVEKVYLKFGLFGGFKGGRCEVVEEPSRHWSRELRVGYLVGIIGGHAAEVRFCHLYLGMDERAAFRYGRDWADGDYDNFPHWRSKLDLGFWSWSGGLSATDAFEQATSQLELEQRRLDELTLRLHSSRHLAGGAL